MTDTAHTLGQALRDKGVRSIRRHHPKACEDIMGFLARAALRKGVVSTDDVWEQAAFEGKAEQFSAYPRNLIGGCFITAAREGWLSHQGFQPSRRKQAHSRIVKVWVFIKWRYLQDGRDYHTYEN